MVFQVIIRESNNDEQRVVVAGTKQEALNKTVRDLKQLYRARIGVRGDQDIRMSFAAQSMEDNKTLSEYGIEHLSIISVMVMSPGGGGQST